MKTVKRIVQRLRRRRPNLVERISAYTHNKCRGAVV